MSSLELIEPVDGQPPLTMLSDERTKHSNMFFFSKPEIVDFNLICFNLPVVKRQAYEIMCEMMKLALCAIYKTCKSG